MGGGQSPRVNPVPFGAASRARGRPGEGWKKTKEKQRACAPPSPAGHTTNTRTRAKKSGAGRRRGGAGPVCGSWWPGQAGSGLDVHVDGVVPLFLPVHVGSLRVRCPCACACACAANVHRHRRKVFERRGARNSLAAAPLPSPPSSLPPSPSYTRARTRTPPPPPFLSPQWGGVARCARAPHTGARGTDRQGRAGQGGEARPHTNVQATVSPSNWKDTLAFGTPSFFTTSAKYRSNVSPCATHNRKHTAERRPSGVRVCVCARMCVCVCVK